ncbi:Flp family type IVb pilin [Sulfitobacter sp. PR48]|uniref:Flp family type IVb pilin n=1 Tax=Sulfitobacter sp. PR48 TaxID=3028383 RepID=UPI00237A8C3C|nr:Flp family type IVb pilin [Sulfitobacter sp. PR48]MDD9719728.1 Flp family type IVb pilin [Sulfitobacter sp. PR48]
MTNTLKKLIARLQSCDEGATLVEYGIALGIAVSVGAGALLTLGGDVNSKFSEAKDALNEPAPTSD